MSKVIMEERIEPDEGILHHDEGIDLMPANIELSAMEVSLVNTMSREIVLRSYLNEVKKKYDYVLIDCMPSLGMITINALAAQARYRDLRQLSFCPRRPFGWRGRLLWSCLYPPLRDF